MIGMIGISHKTAPVKIREKFGFSTSEIVTFLNSLKSDSIFEGGIILATCNRTEIYFQLSKCCQKETFGYIFGKLAEYVNFEGDIQKYFYKFGGKDMVHHLFRVVSGLESMILGEYQIVSQIKDAFKLSNDEKLAGNVLTRLFNKALETGKKVRTETKINEGAFSVSYAAVEKCQNLFPDIKSAHIFVVGTGETGQLVLKNVLQKGYKNITLTNRTFQKAEELALKYNTGIVKMDQMTDFLAKTDVVVTSTSSKNYLVKKEHIEKAMEQRNNKPMLLIDLSVPRNIEETCQEIENVTVINVDDLREVVKQNTERRHQVVTEANVIIEGAVEEFTTWLDTNDLSPFIKTISEHIKYLSENEVKKFTAKKDDEERKKLEDFSRHLAEKYSKTIIKNLIHMTKNGQKINQLELLSDLFQVE